MAISYNGWLRQRHLFKAFESVEADVSQSLHLAKMAAIQFKDMKVPR